MTNDNTRTKANAVFFSVLMVLSMVAVGFAAAPAAADNATSGTITFDEQKATGSSVTANVTALSGNSATNATVVITYTNSDGNAEVVGADTFENVDTTTGQSVDVTSDGLPGEHTAHLFNVSTLDAADVSNGDTVNSSTAALALDQATAFVSPDDTERTAGDKVAYNGTTVYQGEDDLTFVDDDGTVISPGDLQKTAGDAEGTALNLPIAQDAATGTYADSTSGMEVVVQEPRITTAEVQRTGDGDDISEIPSTDADDLKVVAEWNFEEAEDVELTVEDPSGADITNQVLDSSESDAVFGSSGEQITVNLADEDAGEYNFVFEGTDDLDYGGVVEEYTLTTTSQDNIEIEVDSDTVTQGDNLDYTVTGGIDGGQHLVLIEEPDLRDGTSNDDLINTFRNVGETVEVGLWNGTDGSEVAPGDSFTRSDIEYAYAIVEMDGTQAPGAIETQYLDDSTVDLYTYTEGVTPQNLSDLSDDEEDDVSFDVTEGEISLDSPSGTYTVGAEVDVTGTATSADDVRVYAKDNNNWELVQINGQDSISVDSDDTFEETDVDLRDGNGGGNNILSFAGRYDIGVIDEQDAIEADTDGEITTSEWTSATSSRDSINVVEGDLSAEFVTYNGQIAEEDNIIDVNGTAAGQDNVVIAFVDDRGNTRAYDVSVDSDETFEEDDLTVDLNQGTVSAHVISNGRDGNIGDGDLPNNDNSIGGLVQFIEDLGDNNQLSGDQVRDRILTETVDDDASDDLIVTETFRLSDGSVSVDSVYPEGSQASGVNPVAAGDSMVVEGTTNRKADDNSIVVDVLNENGDSLATGSTDEWGTDGVYMVTIDTADLETGSYTVEADTGDNTDQTTVEVVESVEEETTEEETEEETTEEETTEEETTEEETEEETTEEETTEEETTEEETEEEATDDSTPGFGALVALVALVAAALLATRRRDE